MNEVNIRFLELEIKNFKNVKEGKIKFDEFNFDDLNDIKYFDFNKVIGIYGQNGSGKTSVVDALNFIKILLCNKILTQNIKNYIFKNETYSSFKIIFLDKSDLNNPSLIKYFIEFKNEDNIVKIFKEELYYLNKLNNKYIPLFKYSLNKGISNSFLKLLNKENRIIYKYLVDYESFKLININEFNIFSTIFNDKLLSLIESNLNNNFNLKLSNYFNIINSLKKYALNDIKIIRNEYLNSFNFIQNNRNYLDTLDLKYKLDIKDFLNIFSKNNLFLEDYLKLENLIIKINKVISKIIPDLNIKINKLNSFKKDLLNKEIIEFNLISIRNRNVIPLSYESSGIKKMVLMLAYLIDIFNNEGKILIIDEIDNGIFEFLLGEIIVALNEFASGQLLFTSHNLRILEKLNYKNVYFTLVNDKKKFIKFKNIDSKINLRDLYLKLISKGYKNYTLYNKIKTSEIIDAFFNNKEK